MIGSRLGLPIVPVRIDGVDRVLHTSWKMAKPGPVSVTFGAPMRLSGDNYAELAQAGGAGGTRFAYCARKVTQSKGSSVSGAGEPGARATGQRIE